MTNIAIENDIDIKQIEINKLVEEYNKQVNNLNRAKTVNATTIIMANMEVIAEAIETLTQAKRELR